MTRDPFVDMVARMLHGARHPTKGHDYACGCDHGAAECVATPEGKALAELVEAAVAWRHCLDEAQDCIDDACWKLEAAVDAYLGDES